MDHAPRFLTLVEAAKRRIREITIDELERTRTQPAPPRLVDVREDLEWQAGHIPGAEHLGKGILERDVEQRFPDLDEPLILYCGGGFRSALAADVLQQMGYRDVRSLAGGIREWRERKLPITRP